MAEPQFKPARPPIEQFISDVRGQGILQTLNPNLKNDPVFQNVSSALDFIIPDPDNPLDFLGPGGKAASFFSDVPPMLVRKLMNAYKKRDDAFLAVRREADNARIDGRPAYKAKRNEELKLNKANREVEEAAKEIYKETGKKVPIEYPSYNAPRGYKNDRDYGLESLIKDPRNIFHGSTTKGILQLVLNPKGSSPGGLYFTDDFFDPRLRDYVFRPSRGGEAGSAYIVRPDFKNTVVAGNLDKKTEKLFKQMEKHLSKDGNFNEAAFQLGQTRAPILGGAPTGFTKEAGDILKDKGIDSIRYPTRRSDQSDTLVSLTPERTTEILDELSLAELDDLVQAREFVKYIRSRRK